ncbi:MAG: beta-ketoacyl synthase N-terminal-like domain-containing protein, partial [Dehalococcoidia bacterium]|nr:beta-ketoacyl synthase N-terminal-like domain-containing protein [Dehalococcoidia bacterium]
MRDVVIAGVGMHPFGRFDNKPYVDIGREAVVAALKDANISWRDVQEAYCSKMYLPATTGSRILNQLGMTGIPISDVEAACASGGVGSSQACMGIASGYFDVVLAFGVEKMPRGFLEPSAIYENWQINMGLDVNPMYWAILARKHMEDYG